MSARPLLWTAAACAGLGSCVAGAAAVGGTGLAGGVAAAGLGAGLVISSFAAVIAAHGARGGHAEVEDEPSVLAPVTELSGAELGWEWVRTAGALRTPLEPSTREHLAGRRRDLLDELERRDPGAVQRWLADGSPAGSDPSSYLPPDR